jgi:hypothetical protein
LLSIKGADRVERLDVRFWEGAMDDPRGLCYWDGQLTPIGMDAIQRRQSHDADTFAPHRLGQIRKDSRTMLESMKSVLTLEKLRSHCPPLAIPSIVWSDQVSENGDPWPLARLRRTPRPCDRFLKRKYQALS